MWYVRGCEILFFMICKILGWCDKCRVTDKMKPSVIHTMSLENLNQVWYIARKGRLGAICTVLQTKKNQVWYKRDFWKSLGEFLRKKLALKHGKGSMCTLRIPMSYKGKKTNQDSW